MSNDTIKLSRRSVLAGLAGVAVATHLGTPALAQSKQVIVGTWGGDYADLLTKHVEDPILKAKEGYGVVQSRNPAPVRRAKMLAEQRLPRGSTDIEALDYNNIFELGQAGLLAEIDYSRLKNAEHLVDTYRFSHGLGQIFTGMVILYKPEGFDKAPTALREAIDPAHGAKLGFTDILYERMMLCAALAATGDPNGIEDGMKLLLECRKAGARIYPTNEAFGIGLQTGEITVGPMWRARSVAWAATGLDHVSVAPEEGIVAHISSFAIPKNAPNPDAAYAYLDALLDPSAQLGFAQSLGMNPTVDNVELDPDYAAKIGFSQEEQKRLVMPYTDYVKDHAAEMKDWWDKVFKA